MFQKKLLHHYAQNGSASGNPVFPSSLRRERSGGAGEEENRHRNGRRSNGWKNSSEKEKFARDTVKGDQEKLGSNLRKRKSM